jgi:cellobiose phosphorylase
VLGLELRGDRLSISPCIDPAWPGYSITLRYRSASYEIRVENGGSGGEVRELWLDEARVDGKEVGLTDDGRTHSVRVILA